LVFRQVYDVPRTYEGATVWASLLESVSFLGLTGWACGSSQILRTKNGGRSWENLFREIYPNGNVQINQLSVPNDFTCVVIVDSTLGGSSRCRITLDGGATWTDIFSSPAIKLTSVCFLTAQEGFIAGHTTERQDSLSVLLNTCDGGKSWQYRDAPSFGSNSADLQIPGPLRMKFRNSKSGYMLCCGDSGGSIFYVTDDGGQRWNIKGTFHQELQDCLMTQDRIFVVCGAEGYLAYLRPQSSRWITVPLPTQETVYQIYEAAWGYYAVSHDFDDEVESLMSTILFSEQLDKGWLRLERSTECGGIFHIHPDSAELGVVVSGTGVYAYDAGFGIAGKTGGLTGLF
jgi:photosystem II stability/assembly factor-like uncharacterized protein